MKKKHSGAKGGIMIGSIMDVLFGCPHRRLTRPVTPVNKAGVPQGDTYVVCLDCAQQFAYDLKEMRIGKQIERLKESGVLRPEMPMPAKKKLKYALWLSVPAALLVGTVLKSKKAGASTKPSTAAAPNPAPIRRAD